MSRRRISLQAKLLGLSVLLLSFTAVIAVVGIASLSKVDHLAEDMFTDSTQPLQQLGVARAKANENRALLNNHLLNNHVADADPSEQEEFEQRIADNDALIGEQLGAVRPTLRTPEGRAAFAQIERSLEAYRGLRDRILDISRSMQGTGPGATDRLTAEAAAINQGEAVPAFAEAAAGFDELFESKVALATAADEEVKTTYASRRTLSIVLLVLALALGLAAALVISRGIRRSVDDIRTTLNSLRDNCAAGLQDGLRALAKGDLTRELQPVTPPIERLPGDEIGDVARVVNEMRESTVGSITEYNATRAALATMVTQISGTAGSVSAASQQMASTSEETGRAVGEIANAVGDVASGAEKQVRSVESARTVSEEIATATEASARDAELTASAAEQARAASEEGVTAVTEATAAMEAVRASSVEATTAIGQLGAKSEQIGGIVSTITGIAEQTNLLALNAAIEAARAGEQGRGFAVVAEEVRKLAEESQAAAATIAGLIAEIQTETARAVDVVESGAERTADGAATVHRVGESFQVIGSSVEDMHAKAGQIAAAVQQIAAHAGRLQQDMGEVAAVAEQSSAATQQVSASTEQTSASAQEIAGSAQQLAGTAADLEQLVSRFTLQHA